MAPPRLLGRNRRPPTYPTRLLDEYLRREAAVFDQVHRDIEVSLAEEERRRPIVSTRRTSSPATAQDYNRTFELVPRRPGGALLVHGLTDSPSSMRALAERLTSEGYYTLSLRMPGHGGVPVA